MYALKLRKRIEPGGRVTEPDHKGLNNVLVDSPWSNLTAAILKIRNVLQYGGLVITVAAFLIIKLLAPANVHAQISAGAIGICFVVFGLVFPYIRQFPAKDRAR